MNIPNKEQIAREAADQFCATHTTLTTRWAKGDLEQAFLAAIDEATEDVYVCGYISGMKSKTKGVGEPAAQPQPRKATPPTGTATEFVTQALTAGGSIKHAATPRGEIAKARQKARQVQVNADQRRHAALTHEALKDDFDAHERNREGAASSEQEAQDIRNTETPYPVSESSEGKEGDATWNEAHQSMTALDVPSNAAPTVQPAGAASSEPPKGFKQYHRIQIAELRPYVQGENMDKVSISAPDKEAGSPKQGDMIARNPKNHEDQWLVAAQYFADNFEPIQLPKEERGEPQEWVRDGRMIAYPNKVLAIVGVASDEREADRIIDAYNAALEAERESSRQALDMGARVEEELHQQLLAAQAAIDSAIAYLEDRNATGAHSFIIDELMEAAHGKA